MNEDMRLNRVELTYVVRGGPKAGLDLCMRVSEATKDMIADEMMQINIQLKDDPFMGSTELVVSFIPIGALETTIRNVFNGFEGVYKRPDDKIMGTYYRGDRQSPDQ